MFPYLPYPVLNLPLPPYYLLPALPPPPDPPRSALPAPGCYRLDPARSTVTLAARALGVVPARTALGRARGRVHVGVRGEDSTVTAEVEAGPPTGVIALGAVAAGRADEGLAADRDLADSTVHSAVRHAVRRAVVDPVLRFTATRFEAQPGAWAAPGLLEVGGVCEPVSFVMEPARVEPDGAVVVRARAVIDRRRFGIRVPRAFLGRAVRVDLQITAVRVG